MRENLGLLLTKRAALSPRLEGLVEVELGRRFTFPALNARANQTANLLLRLGVSRGDRVALLLMNGECALHRRDSAKSGGEGFEAAASRAVSGVCARVNVPDGAHS